MSDTTDDDNLSELTDDDKLGGSYPPDAPLGVDEYGITAAEEGVGETLAARVAREEPDFMPSTDDSLLGAPVGTLVDPESGNEADLTAEAVASEIGLAGGALDDGDLAFGDSTTRDVATELEGEISAEEAAMHITDPPPMGDGDDYVDDVR